MNHHFFFILLLDVHLLFTCKLFHIGEKKNCITLQTIEVIAITIIIFSSTTQLQYVQDCSTICRNLQDYVPITDTIMVGHQIFVEHHTTIP